jgi:hypothetical protein
MCWSIGSVAALIFWYLQGLMTPAIATLAVIIAWQQKNIASEMKKSVGLKNRFDLFDQRIRVLDEIRKLMSIAFAKGDITYDELRTFMSNTLSAEFLFGSDVRDYVYEVYRHGVALRGAKERLREIHQEGVGDRKTVADKIAEEVAWFSEQLPVSSKTFKGYLDVSDL